MHLSNEYLNDLVDDKTKVKIYCVNGAVVDGIVVVNFDDSVIVHSGGRDKLVFKHAISTVDPIM